MVYIMLHEEELQKEEELEKERYAQYLAEEKIIHDSLMSNDVELNRTMRYFSGVILILLTASIGTLIIKYGLCQLVMCRLLFLFARI